MTLIEKCLEEQQNSRRNPKEAGMQAVQVEAPAGMPAEPPAEAEAPGVPAEEAEASAEAMQAPSAESPQDGRQKLPADAAAEGLQGQAPDAGQAGESASADAQDAAGDAGIPDLPDLVLRLPSKKARPAMTSVTMRLTLDAKARALALASERGMSLSEFCAAVINGLAPRQAGGDKPAA